MSCNELLLLALPCHLLNMSAYVGCNAEKPSFPEKRTSAEEHSHAESASVTSSLVGAAFRLGCLLMTYT